LDLPPSLASALIMEPNARGLHDLACLVMFLQNFSTSYLVGRAQRMNSPLLEVPHET